MSKPGSPEGPDGPEDLDKAFSEIVAGLRAEGVGEGADVGKRSRDKRGKDRSSEDAQDAGGGRDEDPLASNDPPTSEDPPAGDDPSAGDDADEQDKFGGGVDTLDAPDDRARRPEFPADPGLPPDTAAAERSDPTDRPDPAEPGDTAPAEGPIDEWRSGSTGWDTTMLSDEPQQGHDLDEADDGEHFVPPEPPPVRKPAQGTLVSWAFIAVGVLVLIAPGVVPLSATVSLPFGILSIAAGLIMLLLRIKDGPPPGANPNDGSQV